MFRIAICDDECTMVEQHAEAVRESLRCCNCTGEIVTYTGSDNLLADITEESFYFDLILLDIEMPGVTGMELAKKIKPYLPDVKIIFITSHIEYAIDAFELSIFRYVPKDDKEKRLPAALADAFGLLMLGQDKTYTIQAGSRLERIPHKRILAIWKDGKNAVIRTEDGEAKVRKSLGQVFEELAAEEFLFIDRGCIVNLLHIMQLKESAVVLKNGESYPVSRSHLQEVKNQINDYWGKML